MDPFGVPFVSRTMLRVFVVASFAMDASIYEPYRFESRPGHFVGMGWFGRIRIVRLSHWWSVGYAMWMEEQKNYRILRFSLDGFSDPSPEALPDWGDDDKTPGKKGFSDELEAFQAETALRGSAKHGADARNAVAKFLRHAEIQRPEQLSDLAIRQYLAHRAQSGDCTKTLKNLLSILSIWCAFLVRSGKIEKNFAAAVRLKRPDRKAPVYLDEKTLAVALQVAGEAGIWPHVALAVATGLRLGELVRLRWDDVDPVGRTIIVRKAKSGTWRKVPLSTMAQEALAQARRKNPSTEMVFPVDYLAKGGRRVVEDRPQNPDRWAQLLEPLTKSPLLPVFRIVGRGVGRGWHVFRHTFATRLAAGGANLEKICQWLGHPTSA